MTPVSTEIRFVLGARSLWAAHRNLEPVSWSLTDILSGRTVAHPVLSNVAEGYRFQSIPATMLTSVMRANNGLIASQPEHYPRHYIDMSMGFDRYMAQFSSKTRATLARKSRKLAEASGGRLDIRSFHRPEDMDAFFADALPLAARTYQARLLNAALPDDEVFRKTATALAKSDELRAYILYLDGVAVAYLYLPVVDDVLVYAYLGHDQAYASLSPGTVLQMQALEALFAEQRFRYFDFTEGDGAHKALLGTDYVSCATVFLLKPTAANRILLSSKRAFDAAADLGSRAAKWIGIDAVARKLLRG